MDADLRRMPFVTIIIASYNGESHLRRCLPSVLQTKYPKFEVVVFDDASTDLTRPLVESFANTDKRVRYHRSETNGGAARTRNLAARIVETEIIVFLDNDTEVERGWLAPLVAHLEADPSVAGVQSLLLDFHERDRVQHAGIKLIPQTAWGYARYQNYRALDVPHECSEVVALTAAMAVRKSAFLDVGGFDEDLGVYTEDLELSLRLWLSGRRTLVCADSRVFHWHKRISDRREMGVRLSAVSFHLTKNSLRTILKDYSLPSVARYLPVAIAVHSVLAVTALVRGDSAPLRGTARGFAWTLTHLTATLRARRSVVRGVSQKKLARRVFVRANVFRIYRDIRAMARGETIAAPPP